MRFVKPSATFIAALALWSMSGLAVLVQAMPAPAGKTLATLQAKTPAPPAKTPAATQAAPAKTPAKAPAQAAPVQAPAQAPAKAPAKAAAKAPTKAAPRAARKAPEKAAEETPAAPTTTAFRRDPFQPLISKSETGRAIPENLPPGPGGLMVSTLKLEGIVRSPGGMIAVISNPQQRVYFVREGASLYDGMVEKISMESVTFRERGKDPFGKPVDRQVVRRLYPRAGEQ